MTTLKNIFWLGLKELRSLFSDKVMLFFVIYAFTFAIYIQATGTSNEVNNASIAFVDEDGSALSKELINIFGEKEGEMKIYFSPNQVLFESSFSGCIFT